MMIRWLLVLSILQLGTPEDGFSAEKSRKKAKVESAAPAPQTGIPWPPENVPQSLKSLDTYIRQDNPNNLVLNFLRFGKEAMRMAEPEIAKQSFDEALMRIESIDEKDASARAARRVSHAESEKFFKGEPYERSLAYLYRGILYFQDRDYQNARACFRSGQFFDSSQEEAFQGDYVLFYFLEGKCNQILGDEQKARECFRWAAQAYQTIYLNPPRLPNTTTDANCLLLVEAGSAPIKYGYGQYESLLGYARDVSKPRIASCTLKVDGKLLTTSNEPVESVFFQCVTRGGRIADSYNKGKAAFKSITGTLGIAGMAVGGGMLIGSDNTKGRMIGAGVALFGGLLTALSAGAKPNADTRYWDNLPEEFHLLVLKVDQPTSAKVEYNDSFNQVLFTRNIRLPGAKKPDMSLVVCYQ